VTASARSRVDDVVRHRARSLHQLSPLEPCGSKQFGANRADRQSDDPSGFAAQHRTARAARQGIAHIVCARGRGTRTANATVPPR